MILNISSSCDIHSDAYSGDMDSNKDRVKMKIITLNNNHYQQ